MASEEAPPPTERKPLAVILALTMLGLLALLWLSPTVDYWSMTSDYLESGQDPLYPLLIAVLQTLATAAAGVAFFGYLKRRFWGRVTGIVVGGVGVIGTIPMLGGYGGAGVVVLGLFAALIGLLCTAEANTWCPRPSRRART